MLDFHNKRHPEIEILKKINHTSSIAKLFDLYLKMEMSNRFNPADGRILMNGRDLNFIYHLIVWRLKPGKKLWNISTIPAEKQRDLCLILIRFLLAWNWISRQNRSDYYRSYRECLKMFVWDDLSLFCQAWVFVFFQFYTTFLGRASSPFFNPSHKRNFSSLFRISCRKKKRSQKMNAPHRDGKENYFNFFPFVCCFNVILSAWEIAQWFSVHSFILPVSISSFFGNKNNLESLNEKQQRLVELNYKIFPRKKLFILFFGDWIYGGSENWKFEDSKTVITLEVIKSLSWNIIGWSFSRDKPKGNSTNKIHRRLWRPKSLNFTKYNVRLIDHYLPLFFSLKFILISSDDFNELKRNN